MTDRASLQVFAAVDRVVADPLRFKLRLRIGEDAYALRRLIKVAGGWWDAAGAASTGAGVAKSAVVATALFAPPAQTGLLAWAGLAAPAIAVTPVGWVIAAAALAGGGYYGVTRWMASGRDGSVEVIPRFINTPLDKLGVSMFDLLGGLAVRVAAADGTIDATERARMLDHFVEDWGFDRAYAVAALGLLERQVDAACVTAVARATAAFQAANRDCNAPEMQRDLIAFLREVIEADGRVDAREEAALAAIEAEFAAARRWSLDAVRAGASGAADTVAGAVTEAGTALRGLLTRTPARPG